jgi:hypothetical protein
MCVCDVLNTYVCLHECLCDLTYARIVRGPPKVPQPYSPRGYVVLCCGCVRVCDDDEGMLRSLLIRTNATNAAGASPDVSMQQVCERDNVCA